MSWDTLRKIAHRSNRAGVADLLWADGESIRVRYDSFVPADETDDGVAECVVDVVAVLRPGRRSQGNLDPARPGVVRADDPPIQVTPAPEEE